MNVSDSLLGRLNAFCVPRGNGVKELWLLSAAAVDGEPRIVIKSAYPADSRDFLETEGGISAIFSAEAKRINGADYVGGILLYDYADDIEKNPDRGTAQALLKELDGAVCLYRYTD